MTCDLPELSSEAIHGMGGQELELYYARQDRMAWMVLDEIVRLYDAWTANRVGGVGIHMRRWMRMGQLAKEAIQERGCSGRSGGMGTDKTLRLGEDSTMAFNLKAKTIIESATLELDAGQLVALANAAPHLQAVCEVFDGDVDQGAKDPRPLEVVALDPVMELLSSIANLVDSAGAVGKSKSWSRRPKNRDGA